MSLNILCFIDMQILAEEGGDSKIVNGEVASDSDFQYQVWERIYIMAKCIVLKTTFIDIYENLYCCTSLQVSVQSTLDSYHLCSGVVFNEVVMIGKLDKSAYCTIFNIFKDYILTTAVCCTQDDPFLLKVVAGRHDLTNTEAGMVGPERNRDKQHFVPYCILH